MKKLHFNWMIVKKKTSNRKERYPKRPKNKNIEYHLNEKNQIERKKIKHE